MSTVQAGDTADASGDRELLRLPSELTDRDGGPFDPPSALTRLADDGDLHHVTTRDGEDIWLVTGYELARTLLADPKMSSDQARSERLLAKLSPAMRARLTDPVLCAGSFLEMDPPEHTRYRRLLTGLFTVRRMKDLASTIERIVEDHLDALVAAGPPGDLVRSFALPVPSLVLCELLGFGHEEQEMFQAKSATALNMAVSLDEGMRAVDELRGFLGDLVRRKRTTPGADLLSGLIRSDAGLSDAEIAGIANLLVIAGHETTANMVALGTFGLLTHPEQLAALRADPALVPNAVEELLRYLSVVQVPLIRTALADLRVGDEVIPAGAIVEFSLPAANRDPRRYPGPAVLDVRRARGPHLAFGHGIHQCIGQQLARVEMTVAFTSLLTRLPDLRLAVPASAVPLRAEMLVYGVQSLPVTW